MESAKRYSWQRRRLNGLLAGMHGEGLDVGAGCKPFAWWELPELVDRDITRVNTWDLREGDAHHLAGVPDASYDFLFASHILEHLLDPDLALENWVRVVKPGGTLLIAVPHQHLYEQRSVLPSQWNPNHKRFYTPTSFYTWLSELEELLGFEVVTVQTGDWNYKPVAGHPVGEYQIDALLRRED